MVEDPEQNQEEIPADTVAVTASLISRIDLRPSLDEAGTDFTFD